MTLGLLVTLTAGRGVAQPSPPPAPGALPAPALLPPPPAPPLLPPPAPAVVEIGPNEGLPRSGSSSAPPADSLEPPDALEPTHTPPPARKVELGAAVAPAPDTRPLRPIRARRRISLMHEICWNGLAGFGPILTYHATPHLAADFGAGFSLLGWKLGARARYNFVTSAVTPFVSAGFNYAGGLGRFTTDPSDPNTDPSREPVTIEQRHSYLIQGLVGFDLMHRRGFNMLGMAGWSWLLNDESYKVLAGELTTEEKRGFDIAFKGGLVLGVSLGYAFE